MRLLSKSRYVTGLQCYERLWLEVHERDAPELVAGAGLQARFDAGHRVGELARGRFPGGVLIELDPREPAAAIAATRAALEAGAPVIFEASFEADGAFAAVDVLERVGEGFTLLEVKATLDPKPQHLRDLSIQVHLARRSGLRIDRVEVMHLNREHRHPDIEPLFVRSDVTEAVDELVPGVAQEVAAQLAMLSGDCPDMAIGDHCDKPYGCPFRGRCWPEDLEHDVGRAVAGGEVIVKDGLAEVLAALREPIAFLDFETIGLALPVWRGCAPYEGVPVQHSVHRVSASGSVTHHAFLAEGADDPREQLARHLLESTQGASTVLGWSASFERKVVNRLVTALPHLAEPLADLASRIVDLLAIVKRHVDHPEFRGSYSLKAVGPALVPELAYTDLEVADGATASLLLERHLFQSDEQSPDERAALRTALLDYCERDTEILVRVLEVVRGLARSHERA